MGEGVPVVAASERGRRPTGGRPPMRRRRRGDVGPVRAGDVVGSATPDWVGGGPDRAETDRRSGAAEDGAGLGRVGFLVANCAAGTDEPPIAAWVNRDVPAAQRAMIRSVDDFLISITMIRVFPLTGWVAGRVGWLAAYAGAGVVVVVVVPGLAWRSIAGSKPLGVRSTRRPAVRAIASAFRSRHSSQGRGRAAAGRPT